MYIDTHAHLDFEQFHKDVDKTIERAKKVGVGRIINVGTNLQGSRDSFKIAKKYPEVFASVGIHPHDAHEATGQAMSELLEMASDEKVVAIGEIGLDYFKSEKINSRDAKEEQKKAFLTQIGLAKRLDLPVIIHNRDADDDILEILKKQEETKGVIHCFSAGTSFAKEILSLGFYISFTGMITFKSKKKGEIHACGIEDRSIVSQIPIEKILIETDSPFMAPEPYRGKRNEPAYVLEVAKKIAEIKRIPLKEVEKITTQNAERLFGI